MRGTQCSSGHSTRLVHCGTPPCRHGTVPLVTIYARCDARTIAQSVGAVQQRSAGAAADRRGGGGAAASGNGDPRGSGAAAALGGFGFFGRIGLRGGFGGGPAGCSSATTGLGSTVVDAGVVKSPGSRITCTGTVAGWNLGSA